MNPSEHIAIIQKELAMLELEGHIDGKPSCWHYYVQASMTVESLRTALIHEEGMKGDSNGMANHQLG